MKIILKSIVSISMIAWLLSHVDWNLLFDNIKVLNPWDIFIVFLIFSLQFPISAWKWKLSLSLHKLSFDFSYLLKVGAIGFFFNNFLPSSIGGDAYRVIKTIPEEGYKSRAVSAVLLDRIIGFAVLVFLGFLGGVLILLKGENTMVECYVWLCMIGGGASIILILFVKMGFFRKYINYLKTVKKLDILMHNMSLIWSNSGLVLKILGVSFLFQILSIFAIGLLFNSMDAGGNYEEYAVIAAIVGLASVIPLSINGIGIIEGAFAVSAVQLGLGYNETIIVAFMLRILVLPLSLICGLTYLLDGSNLIKNAKIHK